MIPGWLISILTFPGVVIHEWAHKQWCQWLGVQVHKVQYFRLSSPAGFVLHDAPETYKQTFWISIGPLTLNSAIAVVVSYIASQTIAESPLQMMLYWIALSSGMHAFPSDHDMSNVSDASKQALREGGSILHYLSFPFVWLVWVANKLRFVWVDLFYAVGLVLLGSGGRL